MARRPVASPRLADSIGSNELLSLPFLWERLRRRCSSRCRQKLDHCRGDGLQPSTIARYRNPLEKLATFAEEAEIGNLDELSVEELARFRAGRELSPITAAKELETLRVFLGFCRDRDWVRENVARRIKMSRNLKPNEVVPLTPPEIAAILEACDKIGKSDYERLRTRAMVLTLRYTALRIGDVAMLEKSRISKDGDCWRLWLRTEKSGQPVFLPVPEELRAALEAVLAPKGNQASRYYFYAAVGTPKTHKAHIDRVLRAVFQLAGVKDAHAHRFRHTLATELLGAGATFEEVADVLGNSPAVVRKHYAKWSSARQARIDELMERVRDQKPKLVERKQA
jgi:site-specific recombinase XerD